MGNDRRSPSLLDPQARGGDIAEGGFSFQENMLVARVPGWLRREGFSAMIREALGDAEARFFVPGVREVRELIEYKDHQVGPAEFWREIDRFKDLDVEAPGAYVRFLMTTRGASEGVRPVLNALTRVRDALPFYDGAEEIREASCGDLIAAVARSGRPEADADFLLSKVVVEVDAPDADRFGRELFKGELTRNFPACTSLSYSGRV